MEKQKNVYCKKCNSEMELIEKKWPRHVDAAISYDTTSSSAATVTAIVIDPEQPISSTQPPWVGDPKIFENDRAEETIRIKEYRCTKCGWETQALGR